MDSVAQNIGYCLELALRLLSMPLGDLPFTILDVLLWSMFASVLVYFYRKVMGD